MRRAFRFWLVPSCLSLCCLALSCLALSCASELSALRAAEPDAAGIEFFEKKIRPVLVEHCYECHSSKSSSFKGGLRLDVREAVLKGGDSGPVIVPGKPEESLLLKAVQYEDLEMPPQGRLPEAVIADLKKWIAMGAPDPRSESAVTQTPATVTHIDFTEGRKFWAFQPPQRRALPVVKQPDWIQQPIDGFVLAKMEEAGLAPNRPADRRTFLRRVTFDLLGLPPTPDEVEAFISDQSPDADERLVDRLLASPQYGERWARLWLDLMRYAEDQAHIVGNDRSLCYPNAYLFRDWLIDALNADLPFDQFVKLQLAADLIVPEDASQRAALGFIGLGPKYYRRNSPEVMADEWEDRVDVVSRGLLGLTVACARCHDHKFDPISTEDYYALAGVFASTEMFNQPLPGAKSEPKADAKDKNQKVDDTLHIIRDGQPIDLNVHIRGDVTRKGKLVPRRFLTVLSEAEPRRFESGSGRRELAEAIVARNNPLTARVFVNRVWSLLFGRGLVGTPSNFGQLGQRPTHPELLDDLAVRFMESGWSMKSLHRELVLSATYRQSSDSDGAKQAVDPDNLWLSRMNRRRLDIEQWRDTVLHVAGRLSRALRGPSMEPEQPDETRRTLYARISRLELNPLLARFDFPDPNTHSERRVQTTTPLQKLFVLNSPFMLTQAEALAARLKSSAETTPDRIQAAYALVFNRPATTEEVRLSAAFVEEVSENAQARWVQYAQVLLASNELWLLD
jgi:hypothetical protein